MKKSALKFVVAGIILLLIPFPFCFMAGIICFAIAIAKCLKKFLFELIDHIKGTDTKTNRNSYTSEDPWAPTSRYNKHGTPPWEE